MRISVLAFFLGVFVVSAQIDKTFYEMENFKGNITSVRSISYIVSGKGETLKKKAVYRGNEVQYRNTLATYDGKNQVTYKEFTYNGDLVKYIHRYFDEKGYRCETIEYDAYELPLYIRSHTCDKLGEVVATRVCAANQDYCIRNIYYNYTKDNTKIVTVENDAGDYEGSYLVVYDDECNKKCERKVDSNGEIVYEYIYNYDSQNHLTQSIEKVTKFFSYNDNGDCIAQKVCQADECIQKTFVYTYDSNGNWITRITYIDQKVSFITERNIEYQ